MKIDEHIIFYDEDVVALNKPSGLLTIPDREGKGTSMKELLQQKFDNIFTVHRLDRDTSGVVIFARNESMHRHLSMQFENRETEKYYNALVLGQPAQSEGTINEPIAEHPNKKGQMTVYKRGKESITDYKVLESFKFYSWMQFRIHTGRTHQIRVHLKFLGHPVVCDALYGDGKPVFISQLKKNYKLSQQEDEERPMLNRLALHASELKIKGAGTKIYHLEAPLPKDMKAVVQQLRKWKK